ncbi:MFS transporter [Arcanobacterium hippocoleae]|uniref:MFS transporter n=1 Tax=Arcanobacterium hippocoleae TaxID=149017 RepID=UPI00333F45E9
MNKSRSLLSTFSGYRDLPRLMGRGEMLISFLGRMPLAMNIIAILTLVTVVTGSVANAAIVSSVHAIATGIGNPIIGRASDKYGQRFPLLIAAPISFCAVIGIVITVHFQFANLFLLSILAGIVGFTTSPIGALARVRWYELTKTPPQLATALSWESTIDEMSFVLGPAFVGIIAAAISPLAPLVVTAIIIATCVIPFALSNHAPKPVVLAPGELRPGIFTVMRAVSVPLIAMFCLGMYFGSIQAALTAFMQDLGIAGRSGLVYAFQGLGAALTALGAVFLPKRITSEQRIIFGAIGVGLGAMVCSLMIAPLPLGIVMFLTGLMIGPPSVAIFTLAGDNAPKGGSAVAVTALGSMNVLGVSAASIVAGQVVEVNLHAGFYVPAAAGFLMAFATALAALTQKRR